MEATTGQFLITLATPKYDKKYKLLLGLPCVYSFIHSYILLIVIMLKQILGKSSSLCTFQNIGNIQPKLRILKLYYRRLFGELKVLG